MIDSSAEGGGGGVEVGRGPAGEAAGAGVDFGGALDFLPFLGSAGLELLRSGRRGGGVEECRKTGSGVGVGRGVGMGLLESDGAGLEDAFTVILSARPGAGPELGFRFGLGSGVGDGGAALSSVDTEVGVVILFGLGRGVGEGRLGSWFVDWAAGDDSLSRASPKTTTPSSGQVPLVSAIGGTLRFLDDPIRFRLRSARSAPAV